MVTSIRPMTAQVGDTLEIRGKYFIRGRNKNTVVFKRDGGKAVFVKAKVGTTIHICGTTHQIHEDLVDVGFVAITIDLDQQADPKLQVDQLDKLITLGNQRGVVAVGNVDVTIFERATKNEIEAEVRRCIDTAGKRSRFVLSTSCELPPRANPECVQWFMEAAREYGRYDRILAS